MGDSLTARQIKILKSLVDEYINTAEPVGSEVLEKKYSLGVSPATIRNEMGLLAKMGYLRQPHTSAGRVPTPKAIKFYIDQLMEEKELTLAEEVKVKQEVMQVKNDIDDLLAEATQALARITQELAVSVLYQKEKVWLSGYTNVFRQPEFENLETVANVFSFLERMERLQELFFEHMSGTAPVEVVFGEELGWSELENLGVVATRFELLGKPCALGVIGPARLPYYQVIPTLKYLRDLIGSLAKG